MSEFTNNAERRITNLCGYMQGMVDGKSGRDLVVQYEILTTEFIPADILETFDRIFHAEIDMDALKIASNKLFNVLFRTLLDYPAIEASPESFTGYLQQNNQGATALLKDMKVHIKALNQEVKSEDIEALVKGFESIQAFLSHYVVKEIVLFPIIEKKWSNTDCLKLMWSFHDDIRRNVARTLELLQEDAFDLKAFNEVSSKVYFNISTIIFREEQILFPIMLETFDVEDMESMLQQTAELGLHFVKVKAAKKETKKADFSGQKIRFATGEVSVEQAELIFNHLPVDITFVDENDEVRYFSSINRYYWQKCRRLSSSRKRARSNSDCGVV